MGSTLLLLLFFIATPVDAVDGNLPGGTAVSLEIVSPIDGAEIFTGDATVDLPISASASIGIGSATADTTLIYLLDASGSTEESSGVSPGCPDQNPVDVDLNDPVPDGNEIIDCEIGAVIALNNQAVSLGTIDEVAMITFAGDAVAADGTSAPDYQPLIAPDADHNGNGVRDVNEILQSIHVAFLFGHQSGFSAFNRMDIPDIVKTDYGDALKRAGEIAAQTSNENVIILMVSDGVNNAGSHISATLPLNIPDKNVVIHTFTFSDATGYGGTCDSDSDGLGSLQAVVDIQNSWNNNNDGTCTLVSDPSNLPNILPTILVPTIDQVMMQVDGGALIPVPVSDISVPLPQNGPVDIEINTAVPNLPLGVHEICLSVTGTDTGGEGTIQDCIQVEIKSNIADLSISESEDAPLNMLSVDGSTEYMFKVENWGPADASEVVVTKSLPTGVIVTDIMTEQGACTESEAVVSCEIGHLAVGDAVYVAIQLLPSCGNSTMLEANVAAFETDPVLENNTAVVEANAHLIDHGDAPSDTYADAGHCDFSMEWLGLSVDGEPIPHIVDESDDGFAHMRSGYPNQRMRATISTSGLGADRYGTEPDERLYLSMWVDYNQDGDWDDEGEHVVFCDVAPETRGQCNGNPVHWRSATDNSLTFQIRFRLRNEIPDETWVRARLSYGEPVGPSGFAEFGEVEDFTADLFIR